MTAIEPPVLRPLTLSQLLDRAIRLYRQNFLVFVGITAIAVIPVYVLQYAVNLINYPAMQRAAQEMQNSSTGQDPMQMFANQMAASNSLNTLIISLLSFILVQGLATGALVKAIENSYLSRPVRLLDSYGQILGSAGAILIALFIGGLIVIALLVWAVFIPCVGWITGLGMLMFFQYAVYLLIPATVVIEGKRGFYAIWRAWELTRRRFWWVLGFVFVLGLLGWVILIGPAALASGGAVALSQSLSQQLSEQAAFAIQTGISQAVTILFQVIYLPFQLTAIVLMYFDLRVRTEGFDLAVQAASTAEGQIAVETPLPPSSTESKPPITLNEAGYFAAITIGLLLVCGILYGLLFVVAMASFGALQQGF